MAKSSGKQTPVEAPMPKMRWPATIAIFLLAVGSIAFLYYSPLSVLYKIILALAILVLSGEIITRLNGFLRLVSGIYMARSTLGLRLMDRYAKNPRFWNAMADWGLVLTFGFLSPILFKKDINKKTIAAGLISIAIVVTVLLPYTIYSYSFIHLPGITLTLPTSPPNIFTLNPLYYALDVLSVVFGLVAFMFILVVINGLSIISSIGGAVVGIATSNPGATAAALSTSIPGVAPIIPGITIPLFAGLLALVVVLTLHEFSHGVLSRVAKIKVKSSGLLMFGVIPIGAFVEPDEKAVGSLTRQQQNRLSIAGVSSNILLTILFFIPTMALLFLVVPSISQNYFYIQATIPNTPANGIIPNGSQVYSWNGHNVTTLSELQSAAKQDTPNSTVSLVTSNGTYRVVANATGKIGVYVGQGFRIGDGIGGEALYFLYTFFSLAFLINLLAGLVNMLPIVGLDGYRVFRVSIKDQRIPRFLMIFLLAMLFVNVLPWIWIL